MKKTPIKTDEQLIESALKGHKADLELLIRRHQDWIFNIALTFTGDHNEAADLSQEVLIKMITKLSSFQSNSEFRTWLYRIVKNHFLNSQRKQKELNSLTFEVFGAGLDQTPDESLKDYAFEVEEKLLVTEAKLSCMKGMLLCLDQDQRLIYILGELFEFPDTIGAEIMELSRENFRVKLHRAKKQLYGFMNNKCGLVNKNNPCRCARKTAGFIRKGFVNPKTLHFQRDRIASIEDKIAEKVENYGSAVISEYQKLYREHPFLASPDGVRSIKKLLDSPVVKETFNFGEN